MVVEIDGAYGEGGGQILRVSLALSAVTGTKVHLWNIRAKRRPPGLRPQHKAAVEAVRRLTNAEVRGLNPGSLELEFSPLKPAGGRLDLDTGTAGSTTLVLQSLLPALIFARTSTDIRIQGGTNNPLAPSIDYVERVVAPILTMMGVMLQVKHERRGFYPRGGGVLRALTVPIEVLNPIRMTDFGGIIGVDGIAYSSRLPPHIVARMVKTAQGILRRFDGWPLNVEAEINQATDPRCALSPGCGILLTASVTPRGALGADSLGEVGKPAEKVGEEASTSLLHTIQKKAPVDKYLGDQLIVYMALAKGLSTIRVAELTSHTLSCIHVCESFLGKRFTATNEIGQPATISSNGVGFRRL